MFVRQALRTCVFWELLVKEKITCNACIRYMCLVVAHGCLLGAQHFKFTFVIVFHGCVKP